MIGTAEFLHDETLGLIEILSDDDQKKDQNKGSDDEEEEEEEEESDSDESEVGFSSCNRVKMQNEKLLKFSTLSSEILLHTCLPFFLHQIKY